MPLNLALPGIRVIVVSLDIRRFEGVKRFYFFIFLQALGKFFVSVRAIVGAIS